MARSTNAPFTGRIQKRKTNHLHPSLSACNTRPVHTLGHSRRLKHPAAMFAIALNGDIRLHCNICRNGLGGDITPVRLPSEDAHER